LSNIRGRKQQIEKHLRDKQKMDGWR
jgi:hypothetical protein